MIKTDKILAAYERFGKAIAAIPDEHALVLHQVSVGARTFAADMKARDPKITPSQARAGLEQGLREIPGLIQEIALEWRSQVTQAFYAAVSAEYPEFIAIESERLRKILARGKIRTEADFYRVRYEIDVVEGTPSRQGELKNLYALVDTYEARA